MHRPLTWHKSLLWGIAVTGLIAMNRWAEPSIVPRSDALDNLRLTGTELVYFYNVDCDECRLTSPLIYRLGEGASELKIVRLEQGMEANFELRLTFNKIYGTPEWRSLSVPAVFLGDRAFIGTANVLEKLPNAVAAWKEQSVKTHLLVTEPNRAEAREFTIETFNSFRAAPIIVAALLDGINPCAISTLIFLLSFLAVANRRDALAVGLLFTAGVFVSYTLSGLGIFHALQVLSGFSFVAGALWAVMAALTIALGLTSLQDWSLAREGHTVQIELQLPASIKRAIHGVVRREVRARAAAAAVFFGVGFVVSLLEFVCTGQVYVPIIAYVASIPEFASRAVAWLLVYNSFFVLPLVVLVFVVTAGIGSKKTGQWFAGRVAAVKLLTGLFFLSVGVYFLTQVR